jgi:hypothetical protein
MNQRQRVKDLIELAADDGTPEKERVSAALKAVALIRKHDLLSNPLDAFEDNAVVKAGRTIFDAFNDPDVRESFKTIGEKVSGARRSRRTRARR